MNGNAEKKYTYLRGYIVGANLTESLKSLSYARAKHEGQTRKNGEPYIVHPLSMACYAAALGLRDDNIMATILLHDVVEDCQIPLVALPVNDTIKAGVKYMTIKKFVGEDKATTKKRYFYQMIYSKEAVITKAIDRYSNLCTMIGALSNESIIKNITETKELLLPLLIQARDKWRELTSIINVLYFNIKSIIDVLEYTFIAKQAIKDDFELENEYTYLRDYVITNNLYESLKALSYTRLNKEIHTQESEAFCRIHPFTIANYAASLGIKDDNMIATNLLYNILNNSEFTIDSIPVNDTIKNGIRFISLKKYENEDDITTKIRYFTEMIECKEAVVTKAIIRYLNLTTMPGNLPENEVVKYIIETNEFLLPLLKKAKEMWPELSDLLFILRTNIRNIAIILEYEYCK